MASIKISELPPVGADLFQDGESFLDNLRDDEIGSIRGGNLHLNYQFFLEILHRLSAVSNIRLTDKTIQTAVSNSIHSNTINGFLTERTINGHTLNGFSLNNVI